MWLSIDVLQQLLHAYMLPNQKKKKTKQQLLPFGATASIYHQAARAYQMQRLPRIHKLCLNIPWTLDP